MMNGVLWVQITFDLSKGLLVSSKNNLPYDQLEIEASIILDKDIGKK